MRIELEMTLIKLMILEVSFQIPHRPYSSISLLVKDHLKISQYRNVDLLMQSNYDNNMLSRNVKG